MIKQSAPPTTISSNVSKSLIKSSDFSITCAWNNGSASDGILAGVVSVYLGKIPTNSFATVSLGTPAVVDFDPPLMKHFSNL